MTIMLLIISHICVAILTGCAVSLYKDYKSGDKLVCRNVKQLKRAFERRLSGVVATGFCVVFSLTFAFIFLLG